MQSSMLKLITPRILHRILANLYNIKFVNHCMTFSACEKMFNKNNVTMRVKIVLCGNCRPM